MLFDTHAHLDDEQFDQDREQLIKQLSMDGITLCINVGANMESSQRAVKLAETVDYIYASIGVHPHEAQTFQKEDLENLSKQSRHPRVKAIGEIGLDYHYDLSPRDKQKDCFLQQMELAMELKLPVIIHEREAHEDFLDLLRTFHGTLPKGVLHCFSGSREMARECLNLGFMISFAGPLTFKNAGKLIEVAAFVPEDAMLIETDSPYLSPVPYRGQRNNPANVQYVAKRLAEIRKISYEDVCRLTFENGKRLFQIP